MQELLERFKSLNTTEDNISLKDMKLISDLYNSVRLDIQKYGLSKQISDYITSMIMCEITLNKFKIKNESQQHI